jgi:glycosyltransferase involved in cell wall biosynthesis
MPALLCVATITPRKGHAVLVEALAQLGDRPWRLVCAGSLERDPATARSVTEAVRRLGLADRVAFLGEIAGGPLDAAYDGADLFVLPSFHEGYGMAYAEALARGLPIIATTAGAIPETVPADAGILVPPGDAPALARAIARCLDDPGTREALRRGALAARRSLPDWSAAAQAFGRVLDTLP